MNIDKKSKVRIQNKYDTEANWLKAVNFIPLKGETIYYAPDANHAHPRTKVGDGITSVKDLPFEGILSEADELIQKGITAGSVQAGNNTYAGCKGWYIVGLSSDYKSVVLDCYNGVNHASGNIYGILDDLTSSEFYDGGKSTGYEAGDIVTIFNDKHYAYCNTIASVDHNVIYFTEPLPFTKLIAEGVSGRVYEADHVLYVPAKPDCGYIITYEEEGTSHEMFEGAFAFGNGSVTAAEDGFAAGQNNVVIDDHGAVFGRNNISGYANIVGGGWNSSVGQHSFVLGRNLTNTGNQNIVGGRYSTVGGTGHVVTGYRQTVTGELNAVFGGSSTEGEGNVVSGSANLVAGRKNTVQGTGQFVSGSTNVVNGNFNVVGGELNNTNGQRDVLLIGKGLSANGYYQIVSGRYNNPLTKLVSNAALVIGGGTSETDLKTTFAVDLTGDVRTVGNITCDGLIRAVTNLISGSSNNTINNSNTYNLIVGDQNTVYAKTAGGKGRHIVSGNSNSVGTTTKDIYATLTAGQGLKTEYDYQTVVGKYNTAENKAFIIGKGSSTTRSNAFTVGWDGLVSSINISNSGNIVVGTSSVPDNKRNLLVGDGHAIVKADGVTPKSSGNGRNVMIGNANVIGGTDDNQYCNLVAGEYNFVTGCYQSVFGKYSAGDTSAYLIVGNGSSLNNRRNAFTVRTDGNIIQGTVTNMTYNATTTDTNKHNAILAAQNCYSRSCTFTGDYNLFTGDTSNCSITGKYNAVLCSGGNNKVMTQHNLLVGAGHTVTGADNDGDGHLDTGEANLIVGVGHNINGSNYSAAIGSGLSCEGNNQLVIGEYNVANNEALFIIGNGEKFGDSKFLDNIGGTYHEIDGDPDSPLLEYEREISVIYDADTDYFSLHCTESQDDGSYLPNIHVYKDGTYNEAGNNIVSVYIGDNNELDIFLQDNTYRWAVYEVRHIRKNIVEVSPSKITLNADSIVSSASITCKNLTATEVIKCENLTATEVITATNMIRSKFFANTNSSTNLINSISPIPASKVTGGQNTAFSIVPVTGISEITGSYNVVLAANKIRIRDQATKADANDETVAVNRGTGRYNLVTGVSHTVESSYSIIGGRSNNDYGTYQNFIMGENNTINRITNEYGIVDDAKQSRQNAVFGDHNTITGSYKLVSGKYVKDAEDLLFAIGNGSSTATSNAIAVHEDGRVTAGKDPEDLMDLTTKQYVDAAIAAMKQEILNELRAATPEEMQEILATMN